MTPPVLQPDLASKVLTADLRNLIKKVGDGAVLNSSERELLEKFLHHDGTIEGLHNTRRAALISKWAAGGRLTDDEQSEIAAYLPNPDMVAAQQTKDTYHHRLAHYAAIYETDKRNLKRWIKIGRDRSPQDFPPLDDSKKMAAWWSRCMKWCVPAKLLTFASEAGVATPAAPSKKDPPSSAPLSPSSSSNRDRITLPEGSGFSAAMGRAREAERMAYGAYQRAIDAEPHDSGDEEMRHRAWLRAVETVRKMEKEAEGIMAADAAFVRVVDYEAQDDEVKNILHQSLRSLMVRVATKIGLPSEWFGKVNRAYNDELDGCFDRLARSDYSEAFALDAA